MIACLKLYAAAIVAVLEGLTVTLIGVSPVAITIRLIVFGVALAVSTHELRNGRRQRKR